MYRIEYFDDVILPTARPEDDHGTGSVDSGVLKTIGAGYDAYGSRIARPKRRVIRHRGMYTTPGFFVDQSGNYIVDDLGNYLVWSADDNEILDRISTLGGLIGQKKQLWRRRETDSARQWIYARLVDMQATRTVDNAGRALEVVSSFEVDDTGWRNSTRRADTATLAASGTIDLSSVNDGALTVYDAALTITAAAAVTSVTISGNGTNLTWAGSMSTGDALVIDCSAMTIKKAGVAAYSGLTINSGHSVASWLQINRGYNLWYITANGPCSISLGYYPQWA